MVKGKIRVTTKGEYNISRNRVFTLVWAFRFLTDVNKSFSETVEVNVCVTYVATGDGSPLCKGLN